MLFCSALNIPAAAADVWLADVRVALSLKSRVRPNYNSKKFIYTFRSQER